MVQFIEKLLVYRVWEKAVIEQPGLDLETDDEPFFRQPVGGADV